MTPDLRFGDCLAVLRELPDESVHAVVTDPPYGLAEHKPERIAQAVTAWANSDRDHVPDGRGFMGRDWDAFVPPPAVWDECLRVLKPGGHLLAFAGSRTADLMGLSVRMAGFEIRDTIMWVYGSGFPKGRRISADIDHQLGSPRGRVELVGGALNSGTANGWNGSDPHSPNAPLAGTRADDEARTPEAARWEGWNTSLKPAQEPIIVARKPLAGTVAATVLAHGTGGINVDACRVAHASAADLATSQAKNPGRTDTVTSGVYGANRGQQSVNTEGRWPANVVLVHDPACRPLDVRPYETSPGGGADARADSTRVPTPGDPIAGTCADGCPVAELDRQSGTLKSGALSPANNVKASANDAMSGPNQADRVKGTWLPDTGGASRFFPTFRYQAKAPARERPKIDGKGWPTVKPLALMRWLVRLVTPPGGVVLDPFTGSGTTLQAARDEGFASIGIERDEFAYLLTCKRLGLPEIVPAAGADAETGEAVSLAAVPEPEPEPEPVDPVLAAIAEADSYDALIEIYLAHKSEWTEERTAAAKMRRAEIEGVAA